MAGNYLADALDTVKSRTHLLDTVKLTHLRKDDPNEHREHIRTRHAGCRTRQNRRSFPYVLVSSLLATLVSLAAVWAWTVTTLWTGDRSLEEFASTRNMQMSRRFTMTRPHAIVGSALATAVINVLVALVIIFALTPEAARIEPQKPNDSTPLYRLSPIPGRRRLGPFLIPGEWWRDTKMPRQKSENILTVSGAFAKFRQCQVDRSLRKEAPMNATNKIVPSPEADRALHATLALQRAAFLRDGPPTLKQRRGDLMKLKEAILARQDAFVAALDADFGHRARQESLMLDLGTTVGAINYLHSNLRRFMRPERRHVAAIFKPASAKVVYQPLGVVGIVSPWNFPVSLALTPLATALAAGNRVMLKPSEMTPATTDLLASMLAETFDEEQVAVVTGDAKIGSAFSSLPFDHIFFTGSIPVGRAIMRAASENLVPVTLELGGKSPIIVDRGYSLRTAARRIAFGKCANGGQICTSPDYLLLPKSETEDFIAAYRQEIDTLYPNIGDNPDLHLNSQRPTLRHACQDWWRMRRPKVPALSRSAPGSQAARNRACSRRCCCST